MNACMCLRNKCYGMTQSRSSVKPNCGKLEINAHAWEKVVLYHKFYAHLDVARIECAVYFTYHAMFCYAKLCPTFATPKSDSTPLQYWVWVWLAFLGQLKWESLKKRRKDNRLILLYKGLKGKASVPTDDLIPKTRRCRNQHSMAFQTPIANTDVYKGSFFPQTIRDWNALPDSLISSAEDAEDCVAKFTSLVRARD